MITTEQYYQDIEKIVGSLTDLSDRIRQLEAIELPAGGGVGNHTILDGSVHTDSALQAVTRGSIIYGDSTPEWNELSVGGAGTVLTSDGTDVNWAAPVAATHNLLSATHPDTVVNGASRGSLIYGNASPAWDELTHPGTAYHLQTDANDVLWAQNITMADGAWIGNNPLLRFNDTSDRVELEVNTALTNAAQETLHYEHTTSGVAAAGFGIQSTWNLEDSGGTLREAGTLAFSWTDAATATRDSKLVIELVQNGTTRTAVNIGTSTEPLLIGYNATGTDADATIVGVNTSGGAFADASIFGARASVTAGLAAAFGVAASAGSESAAFGQGANASGNSASAFGRSSAATAANAIAIGRRATAAFASSVAIGSNSVTTKTNQMVFGLSPSFGINEVLQVLYTGLTNAIQTAYIFQHNTSGVAAAGFGTQTRWELENAAGSLENAATQTIVWTDVTGGAEECAMQFAVLTGGALPGTAQLILTGSELTINEAQTDMDVRWESDTYTHGLFCDAGNERVGVMEQTADATLHIHQRAAAGAIAVTKLEQDDTDQAFLELQGTAAAATLTNSIVAEADVTTATRVGWYKVYVIDDGNQITDQAYYAPLYTLA